LPPLALLDRAPEEPVDAARPGVLHRDGVRADRVDRDLVLVRLADGKRAVVDLDRVVARVLVVEPEEADVRRLEPGQPLPRERQAGEADVADLAVRR
jgi:hypothetical protein